MQEPVYYPHDFSVNLLKNYAQIKSLSKKDFPPVSQTKRLSLIFPGEHHLFRSPEYIRNYFALLSFSTQHHLIHAYCIQVYKMEQKSCSRLRGGNSGFGFFMSCEILCMSCNPIVALPLHLKSSQGRNPPVLVSGPLVTHPEEKGSRGRSRVKLSLHFQLIH